MTLKRLSNYLKKNIPGSVCQTQGKLLYLSVSIENDGFNTKYKIDPEHNIYGCIELSFKGKKIGENDVIKIPVEVAIQVNDIEKIIEKLSLKKDLSNVRFTKEMYKDPN